LTFAIASRRVLTNNGNAFPAGGDAEIVFPAGNGYVTNVIRIDL